MSTFERDFGKYVVLKVDDVKELPPVLRIKLLDVMAAVKDLRSKKCKDDHNFVCIHDGMACYEAAWKLVEDEVNGNS